MPRRGVSQGYTAKDTGCLIKMRGVLPETSAHARKAAEAMCARVKAACPAARCLIYWMPPKAEEGSELHILVHVDHDEMAVFKFGPMHRKAIAKARGATTGLSWWDWTEDDHG